MKVRYDRKGCTWWTIFTHTKIEMPPSSSCLRFDRFLSKTFPQLCRRRSTDSILWYLHFFSTSFSYALLPPCSIASLSYGCKYCSILVWNSVGIHIVCITYLLGRMKPFMPNLLWPTHIDCNIWKRMFSSQNRIQFLCLFKYWSRDSNVLEINFNKEGARCAKRRPWHALISGR